MNKSDKSNICRAPFLLVFLLHFTVAAVAQAPLAGIVADPEGAPLAFVTVLLDEDPKRAVLTDIEGRFRFSDAPASASLSFRYVGYAGLRLDESALKAYGNRQKLYIVLQPAPYAIREVEIRAGENPADILMRRVVQNRDRNNPEKKRAYACTTYNKIVFEALTNRAAFEGAMKGKNPEDKKTKGERKSFEALESDMKDRHLFLMESVTERSFKRPNRVQEKVTLNRVSGFKNAGMVALANAIQPFSFYGDYLRILDKDFVNPISPGSVNLYFFELVDTLFSGADTVWTLRFKPRKGKTFTALQGVLRINSKGWALQNVQAEPADKTNLNLDMKIEQGYVFLENDTAWFPEQLNFEISLTRYPATYAGLRAAGRSYISNARVNPSLRARDFLPNQPLLLEDAAHTRADSAWQGWRAHAPLSRREQRTYAWLDSVGDRRNFDRMAAIMDYLSTGRIPLRGVWNLDLDKLIKINEFEGVRIGAGITNAQARPLALQRRIETGAYAGYGFRDKTLKYGAYGLWRVVRSQETQVQFSYEQDNYEPGALHALSPPAFVNRSLYARRMDLTRQYRLQLGSRLWYGATLRIEGRSQQLRPSRYSYAYLPDNGEAARTFRFTEGLVFFRYAYGETTRSFLGDNIGALNRIPALEIAYTQAWKGVLGGQYAYRRWEIALYQSFIIRRLGAGSWRVEAGKSGPEAPLAKLFTLNQAGGTAGLVLLRNTFQALPDTLFLADRFVNIYWSQQLGAPLYRKKRSAPFFTLLQNAAWGTLRRPERHQEIGFRSMETPLCETGLRIDDLLRLNYANFAYIGAGVAAFYRWGALWSPRERENILLRLAFRMTF